MKISAVLSKTEQVANFLRKKINSGLFLSGERLLSSRKLAGNFATSKQVVESAFNKLEQEGLLVKRARRGVFVRRTEATKKIKEIYLLGIGVDDKDRYFNNIVKMTYPPYLKDDFMFVIRTCPRNMPVSQVLELELKRITQTIGLDCVLIDAAGLNRKAVEKCLALNLPVIFLGDFKNNEDVFDLPLNQITADNSVLGEAQVSYLVQPGCTSVTLLISSLNYSFNRDFYAGALQAAKHSGIKLKLIEFSEEMSNQPLETNLPALRQVLKHVVADNLLCGAIAISGLYRKPIIEEIKKIQRNTWGGFVFAPDFSVNYMPFYNAVTERIEELLQNRHNYKKIVMKLPVDFSCC